MYNVSEPTWQQSDRRTYLDTHASYILIVLCGICIIIIIINTILVV